MLSGPRKGDLFDCNVLGHGQVVFEYKDTVAHYLKRITLEEAMNPQQAA